MGRVTQTNHGLVNDALTCDDQLFDHPREWLGQQPQRPQDVQSLRLFPGFGDSWERGPKPCQSSDLQVWKNLTAGWPFDNRGDIHPDVKTTIRNVSCVSLLPGRVLRLLSAVYTRQGHGSLPALSTEARSAFRCRTSLYPEPSFGVMIGLPTAVLVIELTSGPRFSSIVFTSARVGEYIESSARSVRDDDFTSG